MEKEKASEVPGLPAASQRRGHLLLSAGGRRPAARPQPDPRPPSPPRSPPPRRSLLISYGILVSSSSCRGAAKRTQAGRRTAAALCSPPPQHHGAQRHEAGSARAARRSPLPLTIYSQLCSRRAAPRQPAHRSLPRKCRRLGQARRGCAEAAAGAGPAPAGSCRLLRESRSEQRTAAQASPEVGAAGPPAHVRSPPVLPRMRGSGREAAVAMGTADGRRAAEL